MKDTTYFGRQPIFDLEGSVIGYEILYRDGIDTIRDMASDRKATASVISAVANYISSKELLGDYNLFFNIGNDLSVANELKSILNFANCTFELLPTIEYSEKSIKIVNSIKESGIAISFQNLMCTKEENEHVLKFANLLDYIKIDFSHVNREDSYALITKMKERNPEIKVIGEKIETKNEFIEAKHSQSDYYQGFFFQKPNTSSFKSLSPAANGIFKIYNLLDRDSSIDEIVEVFRNHPDITINLLQYVNRSTYSKSNEISSIRQAINYLGRKTLKNWLLLLLYTDGKMNSYAMSLLESAMIRARIIQGASKYLDSTLSEKGFLVGILSTLDALLEMEIGQILKATNFDSSIQEALLERKGTLGELLQLAIDSEKSEFRNMYSKIKKLGIDYHLFLDVLKDAYKWTYTNHKALSEGR